MTIQSFVLENFGPLDTVHAHKLGGLNLIIGANSSGKTFLLKALYAIQRAQEETGRGNDRRSFEEVLSDKLYWVFQPDKLGDLVTRGPGKRLKANFEVNNNFALTFSFGPDTSKNVTIDHNNLPKRQANSIFLPPKEVLGLFNVILKSGLQDRLFGFDATYVDLVLALQAPTQAGRNFDAFKVSRQRLEDMFQGRIIFDADSGKWLYRKGSARFSIHATAEGIKKIAILDTLLGNRFLSPDSVVFIDEPESALHPKAISQLLDIIQVLSQTGIQFFMSTHSYFVIKKMYLIALQNKLTIPLLMAGPQCWSQSDLRQGIPDNEIINESIRLFDQELQATQP
jgi:AAA15 family ATPase/GTPase